MKHKNTTFLGARVSESTHTAFRNRAAKVEGNLNVSEVLRELFDAFIEDRITIRPKTIRTNTLSVKE